MGAGPLRKFKKTNTYKKVNRPMGKALAAYDMISEGDRIAVGISGGSDSLSLMSLLRERMSRTPVRYKLFGVHIDLGFGGDESAAVEDFFRKEGLYLRVEKTDYGPLSHGPENRENPCFLCARLRRRRMFEAADALDCGKIALGHNRDDFIETFFLNMFYAGDMRAMPPSQSFFSGKFTVIRPFAFTEKRAILRFSKRMEFPDIQNPCPSASNSKRQEIRRMLADFHNENDQIMGNIFRAMRRPATGPFL
jgi:tRNA 2-thiocytidine biosynthesis protein TtcA